MASRIETLCSAIEANFGAGVTFGFGDSANYEQKSPPRVVWIPTFGNVGKGNRTGGNPRPLAQFDQSIEARIWAQDYEQAEGLMIDLCRSLQFVAKGGWAYLGHEYAAKLTSQRGVSAVFLFAVPMVFESGSNPTVQITSTEIDPSSAIEGDGILTSGEE
jgi:hypothetical protein